MKIALLAVAVFACAACSAFTPPDSSGMLEAQNQAIIQEATAIAAGLDADRTRIAGTSVAAETYVLLQNSINQQLLMTVQFGNPPTRQAVVIEPGTPMAPAAPPPAIGGGAPTPDAASTPPAATGQFVDTVTTSRIRNADGCADGVQTQFTANTGRIYVVTRAVEVSAGTEMRVEWMLDGQTVDTNSWVVPRDERDFCIYFYLDSFSPGNWSAQLSADGVPIQPAPSFTVVAADGG